jgi:hypothetical protein
MVERAEFDKSRDEANLQLTEISRDAVHWMCEGMVDVMFQRFQKHLTDDREELDMYAASDYPKGKSAELFVAPTLLDAPMSGDDYNEALSLKLIYSPMVEGTEPDREGDVVFVYMPLPRLNYVYPEPLQGTANSEKPMGLLHESVELDIDQDDDDLEEYDDKPTELYFEYIPNPSKELPHVRYIMQRDMTDPKYRYRIFRYTIPEDGDEMRVYDAIDMEHEALSERITEDSEDAMKLLRLLANFTEVKQTKTNPHPPTTEAA